MNRKKFIQSALVAGLSPQLLTAATTKVMKKTDHIRLLRHATIVIQTGNLKILIDPMLAAKDAMEPVGNAANSTRIPMVDLPFGKDELNTILKEADAIVVTHTHRDHWDAAAQQLIDKSKLIFCQLSDTEKIKGEGFTNVQPIDNSFTWQGIVISRTGGQHGTGEIGKKMGEVSGFVFNDGKQKIYVAGDTIWCDDVKDALQKHQPQVVVLNAGAAQFITGDPITMTPQDIIAVHENCPAAKLVAVHMDTVNHCLVKRSDLKKILEQEKITSKVLIPADGEIIHL